MDSITLPPDLRSVAAARAFVRTAAEGTGADIDTLVLLVSELVTNVVRHAQTEVTVAVRTSPSVRVEVHDGMAATEAFRSLVADPRSATPGPHGGRGIRVVAELAASVGLDDDEFGGKSVWFEL